MLSVVLRTYESSKEKSGFYRRVYITLYEDIGVGDPSILREVGEALANVAPRDVYNSGKTLLWLTDKMATAVKSHDGPSAQDKMWKTGATQEPDAFEERRMTEAFEVGNPLAFGAAGWRLYKTDKDRFWDVLKSFVPAERHDLLELGKKAWNRGSEYAWGSSVLLAFSPQLQTWRPEKDFATQFYRGFPGYAIDIHTGLGKRVAGIVAKKCGVDYETFSHAMWWHEGELLSNEVADPVMNWQDTGTAASTELWKSADVFVHNARQFLMEKVYKGFDV